jgi:hypothetical protein
MKWVSLLVLCLACTPKIILKNGDSPTIVSGGFSCYGGNCCWPYKHHREVKDYHLMLCTDQAADLMPVYPDSQYDNNGYDSFRVSVKTYFLHP